MPAAIAEPDDPSTERRLTAGEAALVAGLFGDAVDCARVRLIRRRWWPFHPRRFIMAPDGNLWFHPDGPLWRDDFAAESPTLQGLFIHEMTHVWQAQRGGRWFLPLMRHPFCHYRYSIRPGKPFRRYGIEQQAEIARHAFLFRCGQPTPNGGLCAALLPFTSDRR